LSVPRCASVGLAISLALYILVNCVSLALVGHVFVDYDIGIGRAQLFDAMAATLLAAGLIPLFVLARFSFGYLTGLSFYGMIVGFV
jgi:hypothetical protein